MIKKYIFEKYILDIEKNFIKDLNFFVGHPVYSGYSNFHIHLVVLITSSLGRDYLDSLDCLDSFALLLCGNAGKCILNNSFSIKMCISYVISDFTKVN